MFFVKRPQFIIRERSSLNQYLKESSQKSSQQRRLAASDRQWLRRENCQQGSANLSASFAKGKLCWPTTRFRRSDYRDIGQSRIRTNTTQQHSATTHVSPPDKFFREY